MIELDEKVINWDIDKLSEAIRSRNISPIEVTKKVLNRIHVVNAKLNAYITVLDEHALAAAKKAESEIMRGEIRGPLHGIPIGLKDFIFTKDIRTTMGSSIYKDFYPSYDASVVTRLHQAGAIMIGKLNTHEFAYGTTGDSSYFGPVRNPHNLAKITGGSSSGSGAAVASQLCYASLGTDTGGSIRIPSAFCGIVGMKPTYGRVSKWGGYPLCQSLDHIGPMTRTVKDNAIVLNAIAGYDAKDESSVNRKNESFTEAMNDGVKGTVIGIPTSFYFDDLQDGIREEIEKVIQLYKELGAEIRYINIEGMEDISQAFQTVLRSEAYATHKLHIKNHSHEWNGEVKSRLQQGESVKAHDYIQALEIKKQAILQFNQIFEEVDAIMTPVTSIYPTNLHEREIEVNGAKKHIFSILNRLTGPTNLTGLPSISVPFKASGGELPNGFQLIGKAFGESDLYRIAYAYEQEIGI
ncbi:amidase [Sporosarcina pasteurii]|uniref:Glutamyl-tRNA(Gln) amidotransferase subunit A n=1 Tax=Sporosarcina pasteurii TaxID=1474 RepID=A0A380BZQ5_SPOPA|nr:amidase [Sporosarcina pasteurii]MDS9471460.1 amidase [Sporosarcina pasteurii]SUJ10137.1 Glutamyl-tRNA(Gln) amidotransferase subunit A [Sporosarcina pasteurii]